MTSFLPRSTWISIIARCNYVTNKDYSRYGGRGIKVWKGWEKNYNAFRDYLGPRPSIRHTVDRVNNDGNYEPGNVRWATRKEQGRNRGNACNIQIKIETYKKMIRTLESKLQTRGKTWREEIASIKKKSLLSDADRLLIDILEASIATNVSPVRLCGLGIGNGNLPNRLRSGRVIFPETAARVRLFLKGEIERRNAQID